MKDNELKSLLMGEARAGGICAEGYETMRCAVDAGALVDYYMANPDWCMERNFPDLPTLTESFSDCEDKGVFVNKVFHGELLNELPVYVFHNCKGSIKVALNVEKGLIPELYIANGCRLAVIGAGDFVPHKASVVPICSFGKNDISAHDNRYVRFRHRKYEEGRS